MALTGGIITPGWQPRPQPSGPYGPAYSAEQYQAAEARRRRELEEQERLRRESQAATQRAAEAAAQGAQEQRATGAGYATTPSGAQFFSPANAIAGLQGAGIRSTGTDLDPWDLEQKKLRLEAQLAGEARTQGAGLQSEAEARRLAQFQPFLTQFGGSTTAGGPPSATGMLPNEAAARAAAFSRARDISGQTAAAALQSLGDYSAATGRVGSGLEAGMARDILSGTAGSLDDFTREQYIQDLARAGQISDRDIAAGLTRRGQDISQRSYIFPLLQLMTARY